MSYDGEIKWAGVPFLIAIFLLLALAACAGENRPRTAIPPPTGRSATAARTTPAALSQSSRATATTRSPSPTPSTTPSATATASATPSPAPTRRPTATPTPTRPTFTLEDSRNFVVIGRHLWHPTYERMTEPLPIDAGGQPWSPDGTQLVGYDRNRQGLSLVTLATGMVTPLEKTTPVSGRAVWSPNGRYLAYSIPTETGAFAGQIAIYDIEAETETVIVEAMPQHALRAFAGWSFDSASIAFVHWVPSLEGPDGVAVLTVLDVANRRRVDFQAPAPNVINGATWSPTERRLLAYGWNSDIFGRPSPGFGVAAHQAIYLIDVELGSVELVKGPQDPRPASHPYYDGRARYSLGDQPWAPDGSGFVYSDRGRLCIYDFAARETTCPDKLASLVAGTGAVGTDDPSRSPTGEWIGLILKLEHVFCSPLAAVSSDGASFHYTDAARNDCALFWGNWSPRR